MYGGGTMDTIQLSPLRRELLEILKERGYRRLDQPIRLASGAMSSDFIDGKEALAEWRHLRLACEAIVEAVAADGHSFDAVGGLTLGADALAVGIAAVSDCRWFFVRKEPKKRGTRRLIEGAQIGPADTVLLVEDVVTTGGSIFQALDAVDETGATDGRRCHAGRPQRSGRSAVRAARDRLLPDGDLRPPRHRPGRTGSRSRRLTADRPAPTPSNRQPQPTTDSGPASTDPVEPAAAADD